MINTIAVERFEFAAVASVEFDASECIAIRDASAGYIYSIAEDGGYALSDEVENLLENGIVDSVDELTWCPLTGREQVDWAITQFVGFIAGELNDTRDIYGNTTIEAVKDVLNDYGYHGLVTSVPSDYHGGAGEVVIKF